MTVCVWSMGSKTPLRGSTFTGHTHNVFAAEFVPQSSSMKCVTTSADGGIRLIDLERGFKEPPPEHYGYRLRGRGGAHRESEASSELWNGRGAGMGMKIIFVPHEPSTFLTAHQDGRIRLFDLRQGNNNGGVGHEIVVNLNRFGPTSDIAFDPSAPTVFAACSDDPYVRVFDLRHVKSNRRELARERPPGSPSPGSSPPHSPFLRTPRASMNHDIPCVMTFSPLDVMSEDFEGISGLAYSAKGELAISCKGDDVFVIDTRRAVASYNSEAKKPWMADENHQRQPAKRYKGRQNVKTFLKGVAFMGEDQYVTTGGDDGGVYVWCKETCELVCKMQADTSVVNTVLPHPHLPQLVTCGIDNVVRIFEAGDGGVNILNPPNKDEDDMWFEADIVDSEDDDDDEDDSEEDSEDDEPVVTKKGGVKIQEIKEEKKRPAEEKPAKTPEPKKQAVEPKKQVVEPKKKPDTPKRVHKNGMEIINTFASKNANAKVAAGGKKVAMKYIGKLPSGKIFDQTKGNATFTFRLGVGEVIKGWDVGVEGMREGDKRTLIIPSAMGYGKKGIKGVIPGGSALHFDVELIKVF